MVARDHDRLDACADGVGNRLTALLTRRVDHRHQTDEGVAVLGVDAELFGALLVGEREHAQALLGVLVVLRENGLLVRFGHRTHAVLGGDADAAVENGVERTLGEHMLDAVELVFGRHHLAVGVKGNLLLTAEDVTDDGFVESDVAGGFDQRILGRVADALAVHNGGVVVEDHAVEQLAVRRVAEVKLFLADALAVDIDFLHGHLVLGQGARLVGADDRHAAEAFHRLEILDDGVLLCHFLGAHRLHDRDDGAERLGNRRHRQCNGVHQRIDDRLALPAALPHRQHEHEGADDHDDHGKAARELVEALLQRRFLFLGAVHQGGDLADLGVHGGLRHHHQRPAVGDQTARKDHVGAVAERHLAVDHRVGFVDVGRLARQRAFVDLQRIVMDNASVGDCHVPCLEDDDVAGNDLFGVDFNFLSVADDLGGRRRQGFEAFQRLFRLDVLHGAENGVHRDNGENDDGALEIAREDRDDRRGNQNQHQQVGKLPQKDLQNRFLLALGEDVFAVLTQQLVSPLAR